MTAQRSDRGVRYVVEVKRGDGEWVMWFSRARPTGYTTRRGAEREITARREDGVQGEARILELTELELDARMAEVRRWLFGEPS